MHQTKGTVYKMRLSVIIPAYNSEGYIERCICSVLRSDIGELEVVVINDGSVDKTAQIVADIAQKDHRVRLVTQENQGVSAARNRGISVACGKYIAFLDSDDELEGENLEGLVSYAEVQNADITVFGRINHYPNGDVFKKIPQRHMIHRSSEHITACRNTVCDQSRYDWSVCNKLIARRIISDNGLELQGYKQINNEDRLFNLLVFLNSETVAFYDGCSFHNYVREGSLSHSSTYPDVIGRNVNAFRFVCQYTARTDPELRIQLLKYYYISFLNNVVSISVKVNGEGLKNTVRALKDAAIGMRSVISEQKCDMASFKKSRFVLGAGLKERILDNFLIKHPLYTVAGCAMYAYCVLRRDMYTMR